MKKSPEVNAFIMKHKKQQQQQKIKKKIVMPHDSAHFHFCQNYLQHLPQLGSILNFSRLGFSLAHWRLLKSWFLSAPITYSCSNKIKAGFKTSIHVTVWIFLRTAAFGNWIWKTRAGCGTDVTCFEFNPGKTLAAFVLHCQCTCKHGGLNCCAHTIAPQLTSSARSRALHSCSTSTLHLFNTKCAVARTCAHVHRDTRRQTRA